MRVLGFQPRELAWGLVSFAGFTEDVAAGKARAKCVFSPAAAGSALPALVDKDMLVQYPGLEGRRSQKDA